MLDAELLALRRALIPLKAYTSESRRTIALDDPRQAKRFAHVQDIEAALNAAADLYELLTPEPTPFVVHVRRVLAFQNDPAALTLAKLRQHFPFPDSTNER